MREKTVEGLCRDGLERVPAVGLARAEFVDFGEVGGEGGRCAAGGAGESVGGDGDGGGDEEGWEAECSACVGGVGGLRTREGGLTCGFVCFEVVLNAEFLCGGVNNGTLIHQERETDLEVLVGHAHKVPDLLSIQRHRSRGKRSYMALRNHCHLVVWDQPHLSTNTWKLVSDIADT